MVHHTIGRLLLVAPKLTDKLDASQIREAEKLLNELPHQLSPDDVRALVSILPHEGDTAFGLNWTILHAIEASPDWPLWEVLGNPGNEWVRMLLARLANAGVHPPMRLMK